MKKPPVRSVVGPDKPAAPSEPIGDEAKAGYGGPAGGWGSISGIARVLRQEKNRPTVATTLLRQNKRDGFQCVSCAWGKPAHSHPFEFCENGAKATLWELTPRRCTPEFFARHSVAELQEWRDFDLEAQGRLTQPMRYDPTTDHYVPCDWDEAFAAIGRELRSIDPKAAVFYASGRASLETAYLYGLFARLYGHNNLPDSSNMCHETTSVALKAVIGSPVGTCTLADFESCDAIFFFGQNTGSNSPRLLHPLRDAVKRGCRIVTFNPLREPGLVSFTDPQNPIEMLTGRRTAISCQYHQVKAGGDIAALTGIAKHVLQAEEDSLRADGPHVIDIGFIADHTEGFGAFVEHVRTSSWEEIETRSGLSRAALREAARVYIEADRTIGVYGMGLTQHVHGFDNVAMLVNLLLLKGNIGREGAGISPVRGHSNVQGQRTVGISEKPNLVPTDRLRAQFAFEPPLEEGLNTVATCEAIIAGQVRAFIGLGGNFLRAVPERERIEGAWPSMQLTVQIATRLNRSHLINGAIAYLLPCLGRSERDEQANGPQFVSVEDSLSHIHASLGKHAPAGPDLRSELAIVAGIAKATLPPNPTVNWDRWTDDYATVRASIEMTYPDEFHDYETRMHQAGGFYRGNAARERQWKTESGKAVFTCPASASAIGFDDAPGRFRLITLRSNDQFNTTIYGYDDRFRGIAGTRDVLLINVADMRTHGLVAGQRVALESDAGDDARRRVANLVVTPFDIPTGCVGGYYPEMNPLIPLWYHDRKSQTPAAKGVPVRIDSADKDPTRPIL